MLSRRRGASGEFNVDTALYTNAHVAADLSITVSLEEVGAGASSFVSLMTLPEYFREEKDEEGRGYRLQRTNQEQVVVLQVGVRGQVSEIKR